MAQRDRVPQHRQWMWRFLAAILLVAPGASANAQFKPQQSAEPAVTGETVTNVTALEEARKLMELINAKQLTQQKIQQVQQIILPLAKSSNPGKEADVEKLYNEYFLPAINADLPVILDDIAKLYSLHFTSTELQEMNRFYQTELGRKIISKQPLIAQQSLVMAQAWSQKITQIALEKFSVEAARQGLKPVPGT
jgi:uncharacterized protein